MKKVFVYLFLLVICSSLTAEDSILLKGKYPRIEIETTIDPDGLETKTINDFGFSDYYLMIRDLVAYELEDDYIIYKETGSETDYVVIFHLISNYLIDSGGYFSYIMLLEVFDSQGNLMDKEIFFGNTTARSGFPEAVKIFSRFIEDTI